MGSPPHMRARNTDEYGLIIATWHPDSPLPWPIPGMNEQCSPWTWRSRCCTKSYVDTPANTSPMAAPTRTTTRYGRGFTGCIVSRRAPTVDPSMRGRLSVQEIEHEPLEDGDESTVPGGVVVAAVVGPQREGVLVGELAGQLDEGNGVGLREFAAGRGDGGV